MHSNTSSIFKVFNKNNHLYKVNSCKCIIMLFKDKTMNIVIEHPKVVTSGIGVAVTFRLIATLSSIVPLDHVLTDRDPVDPF